LDREQLVQRVAQGYVDAGLFSNIEWRAEQHGRVLSSGAIGYADATEKRPLPDGAIYRIYSMTKPVVSMIAMMLVERGVMRLFDPIARFDPGFAKLKVLQTNGQLVPLERPVTVEDLLTHRAGFTYEFIGGCHVAPHYIRERVSSDGECSFQEMMERLQHIPLASQPGQQFRYSVSTDVLAWICERATGRGIDELAEEFILKPLDMRDTAFHVPASKQNRLMPMFGIAALDQFMSAMPDNHSLVRIDVERAYPSTKPGEFRRGGHGLFSTLDDYMKFTRLLLTGETPDGQRLLSRKAFEAMIFNRLTPAQLPPTVGIRVLSGFGFGLGFRVMMDPGQSPSIISEGEFGWSGAAQTYFWVDPKEQVTCCIMTQYLGSMLPMPDDMRTAINQILV